MQVVGDPAPRGLDALDLGDPVAVRAVANADDRAQDEEPERDRPPERGADPDRDRQRRAPVAVAVGRGHLERVAPRRERRVPRLGAGGGPRVGGAPEADAVARLVRLAEVERGVRERDVVLAPRQLDRERRAGRHRPLAAVDPHARHHDGRRRVVDGDRRRVEHGQPAGAADGDLARRRLVDGVPVQLGRGEPVGLGERREHLGAGVEPDEPQVGAQPDVAGPVGEQAADGLGQQSVGRGVGAAGAGVAVEPDEPVRPLADPQRAARRQGQRQDLVAERAPGLDAGGPARRQVEPPQAVAVGRHPQHAVGLERLPDGRGRDPARPRREVVPGDDAAGPGVEPDEAGLARPHPQVAGEVAARGEVGDDPAAVRRERDRLGGAGRLEPPQRRVPAAQPHRPVGRLLDGEEDGERVGRVEPPLGPARRPVDPVEPALDRPRPHGRRVARREVDAHDVGHGEGSARAVPERREPGPLDGRVVGPARRPDPQHAVVLGDGEHLGPVERVGQAGRGRHRSKGAGRGVEHADAAAPDAHPHPARPDHGRLQGPDRRARPLEPRPSAGPHDLARLAARPQPPAGLRQRRHVSERPVVAGPAPADPAQPPARRGGHAARRQRHHGADRVGGEVAARRREPPDLAPTEPEQPAPRGPHPERAGAGLDRQRADLDGLPSAQRNASERLAAGRASPQPVLAAGPERPVGADGERDRVRATGLRASGERLHASPVEPTRPSHRP